MAFKTLNKYNEDKNKDFFVLLNDGDSADVVLLYQSVDDVLVADAHYIKSADYSGYVHCCGKGCPACAKRIRNQTKIFIPLYNFEKGKIEFWDRTTYIESQLQTDVFSNYPNPSEYVFRITRHGAANDRDTRYEIRCVGKNSVMPYAQILAANNAAMPDYYSRACIEVSIAQLTSMLNTPVEASSTPTADYTPVPRAAYNVPAPSFNSNLPDPVVDDEYVMQPVVADDIAPSNELDADSTSVTDDDILDNVSF